MSNSLHHSFFRILGCTLTCFSMIAFLALPFRHWATFSISSTIPLPGQVNQPISLGISGYQVLIIANSFTTSVDLLNQFANTIATHPTLKTLLDSNTQRQLKLINEEIGGFGIIVAVLQIAFFMLPISTFFWSLFMVFGYPNRKQQLTRAGLLALAVIFTTLVMVAALFWISSQFDQMMTTPAVQNMLNGMSWFIVNTKLTNNIAAWMTLPIGFFAVLGSIFVLLGCYLMNDQPDPNYVNIGYAPPAQLPVYIAPNNPVYPAPTAIAAPQQMVGGDTKQCSTCWGVIPANAKFCRSCGAKQA